MPELPEVETVVRGLAPALEGRRLARVTVRRADLRIPFPDGFAGRLEGRRVIALSRRAKYILATLDDGTVLIAHLGMSGRMTIHPPASPALQPGTFVQNAGGLGSGDGPHDHVIFTTDDGGRVVYTDPRRFGLMTLARSASLAEHPLLRDLGLEPLGNALSGPVLAELLKGRKSPLKAALLDQTLIAGLGNIYVCEALYRARLSPRRMAASVTGARAERLALSIRCVLQDAIQAGGSSLRDYARADGSLGYFQHAFAVYGRADAPCSTPGCGSNIRRIIQGQRSTFFCSNCQR